MKVFILLAIVAISTYKADALKYHQDESDNFCAPCRSIMSYISKLNSSVHQEELREALGGFCELYYPPSTDFQDGPCPLLVESVLYVIENSDPIQECDRIGACDSDDPSYILDNQIQPAADESSGLTCDICQDVIKTIKNYASKREFESTLETVVKNLCSVMKPLDFDDQCRQQLSDNVHALIKFIKGLNPMQFCKRMAFCKSDKHRVSLQRQTNSLLRSLKNYGIETSVSIGGKVVKDIRSQSGPGCVICKTIVKEISTFIKDNRTEENIQLALGKVCSLIYKRDQKKQDQCEDMVNAYTKELIEMLADETDPEIICTLLEVCHQCPEKVEQPQRSVFELGKFLSGSQGALSSIKSCVECKFILGYVRGLLSDPRSQKQVQDWLLTNICGAIQQVESKKKCTKMIADYSVTFFKAVTQELDPKKICHDLGSCRKQMLSGVMSIDNAAYTPIPKAIHRVTLMNGSNMNDKPSDDGQICTGCMSIIEKIDEYLSSHPIGQDVDNLVQNVCKKIQDDKLSAQCTLIVQTFGAELEKLISNMKDSRSVCSKMMLCKPKLY